MMTPTKLPTNKSKTLRPTFPVHIADLRRRGLKPSRPGIDSGMHKQLPIPTNAEYTTLDIKRKHVPRRVLVVTLAPTL